LKITNISQTFFEGALINRPPLFARENYMYCMPHRSIGHAQSSDPSNKAGRARI